MMSHGLRGIRRKSQFRETCPIGDYLPDRKKLSRKRSSAGKSVGVGVGIFRADLTVRRKNLYSSRVSST